jgi:hypothetical protein
MAASRYVRLFLLTGAIATLAIAAFNAAAEALIARSPQARSLQMLSEFARVMKPVWFAASDADIVIIGNSRVRDGFDPVLIQRELELRTFNYGVSGATGYETFRYAQDALSHPNLRTVIIGAGAFAAGSEGQPTGFGFEENRLGVTAGDAPTPNRGFWLAATRYLSGGALGAHVQALALLTRLGDAPARTRADLFSPYRPMTAADLAEGRRHHAGRSVSLSAWNLRQLDRTLDLFCGGRVRAIVFFEPDHASITAAWAANDPQGLAAFKARIAEAVARRNRTCGADIRLFDFMRPNAVTSERIEPGRPSRYYREPVHFRPTTGLMVLRRVLGLPGQASWFGVAVNEGLARGLPIRQDPQGDREGGAARARAANPGT